MLLTEILTTTVSNGGVDMFYKGHELELGSLFGRIVIEVTAKNNK